MLTPNRIRCFIVFIAGFLVVPNADATSVCKKFYKMTWSLNLKEASIRQVHRAAHPTQICSGPLRDTGVENSRLEVVNNEGRVIFRKKLLINVLHYFDTTDGSAGANTGLSGGVLLATEPAFVSLVPEPIANLKDSKLKIRIVRLADEILLGQGAF